MQSFPDAENAAEQVLAAASHLGPPTDLKSVCSLWPQLSVAEEALEKAGYLLPLGVHGAEVLLRKNDPWVRKQYTLAHELGHWVLANLEDSGVRFGQVFPSHLPFLTDHQSSTPEETWCNRFAGCLLMPRNDIYKYLGDFAVEHVAQKISVGHKTFQVSQDAFLTRVPQVTPINVFEVVSFNGQMRARRKFLCAHHFGQSANLFVNELLQNVHPNDFPAILTSTATDHQMGAVLTRVSPSLRSWLVTAIPKSSLAAKSG